MPDDIERTQKQLKEEYKAKQLVQDSETFYFSESGEKLIGHVKAHIRNYGSQESQYGQSDVMVIKNAETNNHVRLFINHKILKDHIDGKGPWEKGDPIAIGYLGEKEHGSDASRTYHDYVVAADPEREDREPEQPQEDDQPEPPAEPDEIIDDLEIDPQEDDIPF